jgi:hypothetical protein
MEVRVTPESQEKNRIAKVLTAALYEAGVKIDQITLLLQKYVDVDYHTARNYIVMERLMDGHAAVLRNTSSWNEAFPRRMPTISFTRKLSALSDRIPILRSSRRISYTPSL